MRLESEYRYRVFANRVFAGNPITLHEVSEAALDDAQLLLRLAQESWSEDNVFFTYWPSGPINARFFSSHGELHLCGHGLLALAHHVFGPDKLGSRLVQSTHGTWLIRATAKGPMAIMPALAPLEAPSASHWLRKGLRRVLNIEAQALHRFPNGVWVALLSDFGQLRRIDARAVAQLRDEAEVPGALICAVAMHDGAYGFRYFAPWHGKQEDSGTGSAHCYLAPLMMTPNGTARALQFSGEGIAEMELALRDDEVWLSGAVRAVEFVPHRRLVSQLRSADSRR
jgi:Predicted epimerase, PhzC/PhzF homolog